MKMKIKNFLSFLVFVLVIVVIPGAIGFFEIYAY